MARNTSIAWTDSSWNPVTGCTEVSPGCKNCYAKTFAERFRGVAGHVYEQGFDLKLWPDRLGLPLKWKRPDRIFVNSMSDIFHEGVPDAFIDEVVATMSKADWHTFQVLTKRPERAEAYFRDLMATEERLTRTGFKRQQFYDREPETIALKNVWWGTSIELDSFVDGRIGPLLGILSRVYWVSAEPLLGPLDLTNWLGEIDYDKDDYRRTRPGIGWVVVGGESGHGARRCKVEWIESIIKQCREYDVPVFVKQLGTVLAKEMGLKNVKGENPKEWPEHLRIREYPG